MPQMRAPQWFLGWLLVALFLFPKPAHAATYLITIIDARIAPLKANRRRWDGGFGRMTLPDVFVQLEIGGKRFKTLVAHNTLLPAWNTSWTVQSSGKERLYIKVMDRDLSDNDLIGEGDVLLEKVPTKLFFGQVLSLRITIEKMPDPKAKLPPPPAPVKRITPTPIKPRVAPVKPRVAPVKPRVAPVKPRVAPVKPKIVPKEPKAAPTSRPSSKPTSRP